ncbi:GNAT family N-acetyltransferase [Rubrobacter tropicus]|uniref:GNAT family N-acetyltransferase n=1 Tax=Rubrobacter tropicus TaxID=2653851 RepID=A0A6G8QDK1_9ACTN|nr:GNAT family N-acetyltransferase [Rubrobacter tropicus]
MGETTRAGWDGIGSATRPLTLSLRPPAPGEASAACGLHTQELTRDGHTGRDTGRSVARYHRLFLKSPHATALVAVEDREANVVGFLLGSLNAAGHRSYVLRRHGLRIAGQALVNAVRGSKAGGGQGAYPTRAVPDDLNPGIWSPDRIYGRGVRMGSLACVVVDRYWRGLGVGTALVRAYEIQARRAGLKEVSAPVHGRDPDSLRFLARLGWRDPGTATAGTPTRDEGERILAESAKALSIRRLPGEPPCG